VTYSAVLAGCGAMSKGWLDALSRVPQLAEKIKIVGLMDIDPELAKARGAEFGLSATFHCDLAEALATHKPDFVFDVVPPSARKTVVLTALANGCHVLSEKPMAASLSDAREMLDAARNAGRLHAIVQNRRYIEGVRRIRAFLESGAIGKLTSMHCDFFLAPHFGGFREQMEHVLLLDMAIHTFDAARFMSGTRPLAVYCHESNPDGSWFAHGASANAIFEMSDGVTFTYRGSWCADGAPTSWESQWRLVCTDGSLIWDGEDKYDARARASEGKFINDLKPVAVPALDTSGTTDGHASVLLDFLKAVETQSIPETDGSDNIKSLAMVFGAIESARTHTRTLINLEVN
jgi:predicted dehydrogenase